MIDYKVLIVGCPRNGSTFISRAFRLNGIDVGHENLGRDGMSSWGLAAKDDVKYVGPGFKTAIEKLGESTRIFHQIRNPLDTIASITTISTPSWEYISNYVNLTSATSILHKSMIFWVEWNLRCEDMTDDRYKIEDYLEYFNLKADLINTKVNTRKHRDYSIEDLLSTDEVLATRIIEMSNVYGYTY